MRLSIILYNAKSGCIPGAKSQTATNLPCRLSRRPTRSDDWKVLGAAAVLHAAAIHVCYHVDSGVDKDADDRGILTFSATSGLKDASHACFAWVPAPFIHIEP